MLLFYIGAAAAGALVLNSVLRPYKKAGYKPDPDPVRTDLYAQKLRSMVQVPTISWRDERDNETFDRFHQVMKELFPRVFTNCEVHILDENLILRWKGKAEGHSVLFLSHQDVVPPGAGWTRDPWKGELDGHKLYGRGTADTKASLFAYFQAAEELMEQGFVPAHDLYLAAGCTEETGGPGIGKIAAFLKEHDIHVEMAIDEGGAIVEEPIQGIPGLFALVGLYEKGMGNVKFTARSAGGHASAPGKQTPLVQLSRFMASMERHDHMKVRLRPEVMQMFERLGLYARGPLRLILLNARPLKPILEKLLPSISAQAAAMTKTTVAFTMAQGSDAKNVLPSQAWVLANLRFIPHQKAEESLKLLEKRARKYDLEMEVLDAHDPSRILDKNGNAFRLVEETVRRTFPGMETIPYVVTGGTDVMGLEAVADACVRFVPVIFGPEQMQSMHGVDECIDTRCLAGAVDWYKNFIGLLEH